MEDAAVMLLYESADVARELGVVPSSVKNYAKAGLLRVAARTPRGTRLFRPVEVEQFRKARAAKAARQANG